MQDGRGTGFDYNKRHPWNVYSITVNHVMVVTWHFRINYFKLTTSNLCLVSSSNIGSTERCTPYAGAVVMLLHINRKFTMGKLKSSLFSPRDQFEGTNVSLSFIFPHITEDNQLVLWQTDRKHIEDLFLLWKIVYGC